MVEEGHTVGNHTYHHPDMSEIADVSSFQKEVEDVKLLYEEITDKEMVKFYRPPQGKYSESNLKMAKELGYYTFSGVLPMWTGIRIISQQKKRPLKTHRTYSSGSCCAAAQYFKDQW